MFQVAAQDSVNRLLGYRWNVYETVDHLFGNMEFDHKQWVRCEHDTKEQLPPELLLGFKTINIKSILEPGCGTGWVPNCLSEDIFYCGFDASLKLLDNTKGRKNTFFIETQIQDVAADPSLITSVCGRDKFDALLSKGVLQLTTGPKSDMGVNLMKDWVTILETFHIQHYFLYETIPNLDLRPFIEKGFKLLFSNPRLPSVIQIWRTS